MNLFETAAQLQAKKEATSRKGAAAPLRDTLTIPYFKGYVRKGDRYTLALTHTVKDDKGKVKVAKVAHSVKPLSGAFLISYFACLAYDLCKVEKQPCTIFVVQALIAFEGFNLDEYSQGKVQGSSRVTTHLKAIAEQRGLNLTIDKKSGEIKGLEKYACEVLQTF